MLHVLAKERACSTFAPGRVCLPPRRYGEGHRFLPIDFSGKLIEIARRNVPGADFQQGDAQALPYKPESFDAVVCGYGIIHVPEPKKALSEMHRVLKPAGYLAVSVWEAPKPGNGFGLLFSAINKVRRLQCATASWA